MVFAFYQFVAPAALLQPRRSARRSRRAARARSISALEARHAEARRGEARRRSRDWSRRADAGDDAAPSTRGGRRSARPTQGAAKCGRTRVALDEGERPEARRRATRTTSSCRSSSRYLPAGLVGLVLAAIFAASMSSTAAELNALSSTTVVDVYKRLVRPRRVGRATTSWSRSSRRSSGASSRSASRCSRSRLGVAHRGRQHPRLALLRHDPRHLPRRVLREARRRDRGLRRGARRARPPCSLRLPDDRHLVPLVQRRRLPRDDRRRAPDPAAGRRGGVRHGTRGGR